MNRLFILGASDVKWPEPKINNWVKLLNQHYDVTVFGEHAYSNIDIMMQVGELPTYKDGDRLIFVFVRPKVPLYLWGEFKHSIEKSPNDLSLIIKDKSRYPFVKKIFKEIKDNGFYNGMEYRFYKKMKELLFEYNPIFTTIDYPWADKYDFIQYEKFTSFEHETNRRMRDNHLGLEGNKDFYRYLLNRLGDGFNPKFEEEDRYYLQ